MTAQLNRRVKWVSECGAGNVARERGPIGRVYA